MMLPRLAAALALLAVTHGGAWWHGRGWERDRWQARVAALEAQGREAQARAQGAADALERERARVAAVLARLGEDADADPDAARVALPERAMRAVGSVQ
jgi:hypothetical protein